MASPSKRKAEESEFALNGTGNKRVRTETPPRVNGNLNGTPSNSIADQTSGRLSSQTASIKTTPKAIKRKRKKAKKDAQQLQEDKLANEEPERHSEGEPEGVASSEIIQPNPKNNKEKGHHKKVHQKQAVVKQAALWELTDPAGGALVDLDPVFSYDEQHYLLAYNNAIAVYSVSTGILVRTLLTSRKGYVTGYSIPPEEQSHLFVSMSTGLIEKWSWQDGERISTFSTQSEITQLVLSTKRSQDLVYTIERYRKQWAIVAHRLIKGEQGERHSLYRNREPITHFQVLNRGKCIVASAGKHLIVGSIREPTDPTSKEISYDWRDLECQEWITCLDARLLEGEVVREEKQLKKPKPKLSTPVSIDVVVGGLQGSLWVYRNFLGRFLENEQRKGSGPFVPQRLHWHRNGVGAVRWAVDGNYLISGGDETVLVRWQLDTGKSTKLPHLSAPIESIVVSSSESLYGIRFSNNTATVLSSAELEPIINVSGPRVRIRRRPVIEPPNTPLMSSYSKDKRLFQSSTRSAATIIPDPGRLLLAVPGSSSARSGLPVSSNAPFLQTLDIRNAENLSLQALARTNTTTKKVGPDMNLIVEPNVILIQVSHDGQWLATVDEWIPPSVDHEHLSLDEVDLASKRLSHMEIYLKIWSRKAHSDTWELVSKFKDPHIQDDGQSELPEKVLDLISDPTSLGFMTIGTDARVKVWRANRRVRDGQQIHAQDGTPLISWYYEPPLSLPIATNQGFGDKQSVVGRLACSPDGSLLAAAYQADADSEPFLYLLATSPLEICSYTSDLIRSKLKAIGLLSQYLVILSETIIVYDIVNSTIRYVHKAASASKLSETKALSLTHLAVDQNTNTFAIVCPELKDANTDIKSYVTVFDPTQPEPLFTANFKHATVAALPLSGLEQGAKGGYVILDGAAYIRYLKPKAKELVMTDAGASKSKKKRLAGLDSLFGVQEDGNKALVIANGTSDRTSETVVNEMELGSDEIPFVREHQLKEALDVGFLYNLPRVENLFDKVAGLYISRPND